MSRNKGEEIGRERRQQLVASLLASRPRVTQREIQAFLAGKYSPDGPRILNPRTRKPYSLGTINGDIRQLRQEYRDKRDASRDEWIAQLLLLYEELLRKNMKAGDLSEARHVAKSLREMLGLDAPSKTELTGAEGGAIVLRWPEQEPNY